MTFARIGRSMKNREIIRPGFRQDYFFTAADGAGVTVVSSGVTVAPGRRLTGPR